MANVPDLPTLLNDTMVRNCSRWKAVGIELGFKTNELDIIAADYRKIDRCKCEMLKRWLNKDSNPTLTKLHRAITEANKRYQRECDRNELVKDEKKAKESVNRLERLLDNWEQRNQQIVSDMEKLLADFKREERWLLNTKKWNEEKHEFQQGETATQRNKLILAIKQREYINNDFVQEFLRSNGYDSSNMNENIVEGILRQAVMKIDIERATIVERRFRAIKKHHRQIQDLQNEIKKSTYRLEERLRAYEKIQKGLQKLEVSTNYLEKLNDQSRCVQVTMEECNSTETERDKIYQEEQTNFNSWNRCLDDFITSLDENIGAMTVNERTFMEDLYSLLADMVEGIVGKIILPVVGAVYTALTRQRARTRWTWGWARARERDAALNSEVASQIRKYREILERGRRLSGHLKTL